MKCPKCLTEGVEVVDTRNAYTRTVRRRKCKTCGHKYTTWEMPESELSELRKRSAALDDLRKIILGDKK
jgi:transcriptional regulator NrdR family protein